MKIRFLDTSYVFSLNKKATANYYNINGLLTIVPTYLTIRFND